MKIQTITEKAAVGLLSAPDHLDEVAIDRSLVHGTGIRVTTPRVLANLLVIAAIPFGLAAAVLDEERPRMVRQGSVMVFGRHAPISA